MRKQNYLFSYLFIGNDNFREERREKSEKRIEQKKRQLSQPKIVVSFGAGGRGRTDTVLLPRDFESRTSANSITPANIWSLQATNI